MVTLNKGSIFRGRTSEIAVCFIDANSNNLPTCGMTDVSVRIANQDGSFLMKQGSSAISWGVGEKTYMYVFHFSDTETALFKVGEDQSIWLEIMFGSSSTKYEFRKFLTVADDLF